MRITKADTSVERSRYGTITVAAMVPGDDGHYYRASRAYAGYSVRDAERDFRQGVNALIAEYGHVPYPGSSY